MKTLNFYKFYSSYFFKSGPSIKNQKTPTKQDQAPLPMEVDEIPSKVLNKPSKNGEEEKTESPSKLEEETQPQTSNSTLMKTSSSHPFKGFVLVFDGFDNETELLKDLTSKAKQLGAKYVKFIF
jgi:hypothetical protein